MSEYSDTLVWLLGFAGVFAILGIVYTRKQTDTLEDYVVARNSQTALATVFTLMATSLGAWILFAPAQAATWGGLAAITGYALGSMAPRMAMVPLGRRMRTLIPRGHTLSEYVVARYGGVMYALVLIIMLFYMFITLTAEITAVAKLVSLIAPVPLWLTALIVLVATLTYTYHGGLKASIMTDKVQMLVIVPLLLMLILYGWLAIGDLDYALHTLKIQSPGLVDVTDGTGIKAGFTFFVAILLTGLFHQGNWQRVYAAESIRAMQKGFFIAGICIVPIVFVMGLFGLAYVALDAGTDSSVALFSVILNTLPGWFVVALLPLGLALAMSSTDTVISAFSSLVAVDGQRLVRNASPATMLKLSRWVIVPLSVPVWLAASKGYSVLYLFLLADLLCSAAAFPVFFGLYSRRYDGFSASVSTLTGVVAGLLLFPAPDQPSVYLLESFLLAAVTPVLVSLVLLRFRPNQAEYDLSRLDSLIRRVHGQEQV